MTYRQSDRHSNKEKRQKKTLTPKLRETVSKRYRDRKRDKESPQRHRKMILEGDVKVKERRAQTDLQT